jgi:hypothetical protein
LAYKTKVVGKILVIHFISIKYNYINEAVFIKVILLKGAKSFHSLFRGITCGVLLCLPPVPRLGSTAHRRPTLHSLRSFVWGY